MEEEKEIEIISWVKFNKPDTKSKVLKLVQNCNTKAEFINQLKSKFELSISDAYEVANRFYKKD